MSANFTTTWYFYPINDSPVNRAALRAKNCELSSQSSKKGRQYIHSTDNYTSSVRELVSCINPNATPMSEVDYKENPIEFNSAQVKCKYIIYDFLYTYIINA